MFNTIVQILFAELATFINFFFFFFFTSELFSSAYLTLQCLLHGCKFRVNPNKMGIGEKSPTFVQTNFTP